MNPIFPSVAFAAVIVCLSFGLAEVARWSFTRTWLLNPRKLVIPALGTGSWFAILGTAIVIPVALMQPEGAGSAPSRAELVTMLVLVCVTSYVGWLSMVAAHQRLKGWPIRDAMRVIGRAVVPALIVTVVLVALVVAICSSNSVPLGGTFGHV